MATFLGNRYSYYRNSGTNTPYTESLPSPPPNNHYSDWRFRADIYLESQSTTTNTSEVKIYFYIERKDRTNYNTTMTGWNAPQASYGNISINGNWYQISKSVTLNVGINATAWTTYSDSELIGSVTRTISHNANGTGSFTTQCYGRLWVGQEALYTSNGSYTLPTIPRYATINSFTFEKASGVEGLSRLTCGWSVSNTCDAVEYSLSGGGWTSSGTSGTSGSFNINGLTPNTQYSLKIRVKRTDSQLWTESGTIYQTTLDYARVTGADSINDEGSPYMTFTNISGAVIDAYIEYGFVNGSATAALQRANIPNTGSYLFTLTSGEKSAIYSKMTTSNSQTIRYTLVTVVGGVNTYWSFVDRTFTIINANPTFTTFTYADINPITLALTGNNNQIIVKGYSSLRGIVTSANKMVAIKGATAKEYQLAVTGSTPVKANYSSSSTVNLDIGVVSNNVFITNAIDSRNNATEVTVNASTYKEYFNVTKGAIADNTITRTGSVSKETTLKLKGTFWNESFGSVTNDFVNAKYRYKDTDDANYSAYTDITLTKNGNEFSYNSTIAGDDGASGFLIENSYNVQVLISDKLSSVTYDFILGTGTPNMSIHKDGVAFKGLYDTNLGGALQVNGTVYINSKSLLDMFYPIGTIYETTSTDLDTTTKMGAYFGGTWEVYGAGRVLVAKSADTEFDTIGETGGSKYMQTHVHKITLYDSTQNQSESRDLILAQAPAWNNHWREAGYTVGSALTGIGGQNVQTDNQGNLQPYIVVYRYRRTA